MTPLLEQWMASLVDADVVVNDDDVLEEAQGNLWWFGLTRAEAASVTADDVVSFMRAVNDLRRAQLTGAAAPRMVVYWWHDEPTAQLRCGMVAASHGVLPLPPGHELVESADVVAAHWLTSPALSGIPGVDARPRAGAVWAQHDDDDLATLAPRAWVVTLP